MLFSATQDFSRLVGDVGACLVDAHGAVSFSRPSFDIDLHLRDSAVLPGNLLAQLAVVRLAVG